MKDNFYQLLIQYILYKSTISEEQLNKTIKSIIEGKELDKMNSKDVIVGVNKLLEKIGYELKSGKREHDGGVFYGIVDHNHDDITNLSNNLSPIEISLFKKILDYFIEFSDKKLHQTDLKTTAFSELNMTKPLYEAALVSLEREKWIIFDNEYIFLGEIALLGVNAKLKSEYGEQVKKCILCREIVISGSSCHNCSSLMHIYCYENYQKQTNNEKCVSCLSDASKSTSV